MAIAGYDRNHDVGLRHRGRPPAAARSVRLFRAQIEATTAPGASDICSFVLTVSDGQLFRRRLPDLRRMLRSRALT
jgi:hypothetical protein